MTSSEIAFVWTCRCCGRQYATLPLDFACDAPAYWRQLSEEEQKQAFLSSDVCVIGEDRFIRGCLELPVQGRRSGSSGACGPPLRASLQRAYELWDAPGPPDEPARFGWLSNELKAFMASRR